MEKLNKVDYELLVSKEFVENMEINREALLVSALCEAIKFYTALIKKNKSKEDIQKTVDRLKNLYDTHQLMHLHLLIQMMYADLTTDELDDLYVASLCQDTMEIYGYYFCQSMIIAVEKYSDEFTMIRILKGEIEVT